MINIDGSYGEGGGQILRSAIALSVLSKKPVKISKIRANRSSPGIKPQHYTAIKIIKDICDAKTEGLDIGSSNLVFTPGKIKGGNYKFDIGTAGSIVLVFQACLLSLVKTKEKITIRLTGGTDVKWSPSWDFFKQVFIPTILKMGISVNAELIKRGYYPKGGGEAILTINPNKILKPLSLDSHQVFNEVKGIIHLGNLPEHIGNRMKHAVIKTLIQNNMKSSINIEFAKSLSTGTGITLWVDNKKIVLGYTVLGERGIPAEKIGENCANEIVKEIHSGSTIDIYNYDQIIPYMAIIKDEISTCLVRNVSSHAETNMWLVSQFFESKNMFDISIVDNLKMVKINGKFF